MVRLRNREIMQTHAQFINARRLRAKPKGQLKLSLFRVGAKPIIGVPRPIICDRFARHEVIIAKLRDSGNTGRATWNMQPGTPLA